MTDAFARMKSLVGRQRKSLGTLAAPPPGASWRTIEGVASRPVMSAYRTVIRTAGVRTTDRPVPLLLDHEADLWLGWITRLWPEAGALHFAAAVPPARVDTLVDEMVAFAGRAERPVLVSMATEKHATTGREVTACDLIEISLLTGTTQGIDGCHVLRAYQGRAPRALSSEAARLLAAAERREDERLAAAWRAGNARMGWRT